jgi:hypothetical protein
MIWILKALGPRPKKRLTPYLLTRLTMDDKVGKDR